MRYIIGAHETFGMVGSIAPSGIATYRPARVGSGWEVDYVVPEGSRVLLTRLLPRRAGIGMRMREVVASTCPNVNVKLVYFSTKLVSPSGELMGLFKCPGDAVALRLRWRAEEAEILPFGDIVEVPPGKFHGFRTNLETGAFEENASVVAWW